LQDFIDDGTRLAEFSKTRNDPNGNSQSHLAPWCHFGQISVQRCVLEVSKYANVHPSGVDLWRDVSITWRELSDNFCYYNPDYDNINAAPQWARETLQKHLKDKRSQLYTLKQLDDADTYDSLWNASQIQMRLEGWMHGYVRMYWAKKILEWTETPEQALEFTIYLNDRYSLDGREPAGYFGIQWSITGLYDGPFDERPVHGTVRGMTANSRKFDLDLYVSRFLKRKNEM
jgi:deoxyribodipyrimidine photo-lyase